MRLHVLKKGETLQTLSARYQMPVCCILRANPALSVYKAGSNVRIPPVDYCAQQGDCAADPQSGKHVLTGSETLLDVARMYHITLYSLLHANKLRDADVASAGRILSIPLAPPHSTIHRAASNQTLADIASLYRMDESALRYINGLDEGAETYPGMELYVYPQPD